MQTTSNELHENMRSVQSVNENQDLVDNNLSSITQDLNQLRDSFNTQVSFLIKKQKKTMF